jgi:hypothetical protein
LSSAQPRLRWFRHDAERGVNIGLFLQV